MERGKEGGGGGGGVKDKDKDKKWRMGNEVYDLVSGEKKMEF